MIPVIGLLILAAILDRGRTIRFLGGVWDGLVVVFFGLLFFAVWAWLRSAGWI